ncbi:MAG: thiamine phosphate synthase [bacterium]|nr:thiamine phosphate synthase [bacterium]
MEEGVYSAIDANINRALEGLRVCEDIFRFVKREGIFSAKIKEIRHKIVEEVKIFPAEILLHKRDVERDPIKFDDLDGEQKRDSLFELAKRNLHRATEAMRSIEEFFKLLHPDMNRNPFQEIRFSLYSIEKEMNLPLLRIDKVAKFKDSLYAILDSSFVQKEKYPETALRLIDGGASIIQLRMKDASMRKILDAARDVSAICRERDIIFIINDYPEIASLCGADGVHLGQDDLPPRDVRRVIPAEMLIGVSTHTMEQAMQAYEESPDYIAIGPVHDTKSKYGKMMEGIGEDIVRDLCKKIDVPVVSIGGLDHKRIGSLRESGCSCFAVVSYLYRQDKIEDNCRRIIESI